MAVNIADLCDPRRTVDAAFAYTKVHTLFKQANNHFVTGCGMPMTFKQIMILRQRPEDITCPECKEG